MFYEHRISLGAIKCSVYTTENSKYGHFLDVPGIIYRPHAEKRIMAKTWVHLKVTKEIFFSAGLNSVPISAYCGYVESILLKILFCFETSTLFRQSSVLKLFGLHLQSLLWCSSAFGIQWPFLSVCRIENSYLGFRTVPITTASDTYQLLYDSRTTSAIRNQGDRRTNIWSTLGVAHTVFLLKGIVKAMYFTEALHVLSQSLGFAASMQGPSHPLKATISTK